MVKELVRKALAASGLELRRLSPQTNPAVQLARIVADQGIDLVFDVGANLGQFGRELRRHGYGGTIVSFEPLSAAHRALERNSAKDPAWLIHPRCALGEEPGTSQIHVAGNSYSSSLRRMKDRHAVAAPASRYVGIEDIAVDTLDRVAPQYLARSRAPFLKIDTQGFEKQVLEGAREVLPRIKGALLELSLVELYEGQTLWLELVRWMEGQGFVLWALSPGFVDQQDGRSLQLDGVFVRPAAA